MMLYTSMQFFVLFCVALLGYYVIPRRFQWVYLLACSFGFYLTFSVKHTVLLAGSIGITYLIALAIGRCQNPKSKRVWVVVGLVGNIGLLCAFKYMGWIFQSIQMLMNRLGIQEALPVFQLAVPAGISFYTFKAISYIIDVYRGTIEPEKNVGKYALYVSFFPQIISGPIERSYRLLPQLEHGQKFDYDGVKNGFLLFLWGLIKKAVVADRLSMLVDQVFNHVADYNAPAYCIAILFFTFQIYFDFSGFSDIAIGCTNMLGLSSIRNFDRPYFSKSIAEFWRRWHISLSTWFRDYLYIPLGGNRVSFRRWMLNILIVFGVSGIWHGANWTYVIWGMLHGIYQIIGKLTKKMKGRALERIGIDRKSGIYTAMASVITFGLVAFSWIFFRANSLADASTIIRSIIKWDSQGFDLLNMGMGYQDLVFSVVIVALFMVFEGLQSRIVMRDRLQKLPLVIRWTLYLGMIFLFILFGIYGDLSSSSFIYFQF